MLDVVALVLGVPLLLLTLLLALGRFEASVTPEVPELLEAPEPREGPVHLGKSSTHEGTRQAETGAAEQSAGGAAPGTSRAA